MLEPSLPNRKYSLLIQDPCSHQGRQSSQLPILVTESDFNVRVCSAGRSALSSIGPFETSSADLTRMPYNLTSVTMRLVYARYARPPNPAESLTPSPYEQIFIAPTKD